MSERDAAVQAAVDSQKAHAVSLQQKSVLDALVARARGASAAVGAIKAELVALAEVPAEVRAEVAVLAEHIVELVAHLNPREG